MKLRKDQKKKKALSLPVFSSLCRLNSFGALSPWLFFLLFFNLKSGFSCGGFHLLLFSKSILEQLSTDGGIQDCSVFAFLCSVIVTENSFHALNQSDAKLTPITTWSHTFSRASGSLVGFILSSYWLFKVFPFF